MNVTRGKKLCIFGKPGRDNSYWQALDEKSVRCSSIFMELIETDKPRRTAMSWGHIERMVERGQAMWVPESSEAMATALVAAYHRRESYEKQKLWAEKASPNHETELCKLKARSCGKSPKLDGLVRGTAEENWRSYFRRQAAQAA